jgi:hypothetical protein
VAVAFFVVQHAATGSCAAIATRAIVFDADLATAENEAPKGRRSKKRPVDVETTPAQLAAITLAEPLTVYIPK